MVDYRLIEFTIGIYVFRNENYKKAINLDSASKKLE
jgi:hypothetical protein